MYRVFLTLTVAVLVSAPGESAQTVVRYEPSEKDLKYVYATVAPVATLKPGDILDTRTFDCFGGAIKKEELTRVAMELSEFAHQLELSEAEEKGYRRAKDEENEDQNQDDDDNQNDDDLNDDEDEQQDDDREQDQEDNE